MGRENRVCHSYCLASHHEITATPEHSTSEICRKEKQRHVRCAPVVPVRPVVVEREQCCYNQAERTCVLGSRKQSHPHHPWCVYLRWKTAHFSARCACAAKHVALSVSLSLSLYVSLYAAGRKLSVTSYFSARQILICSHANPFLFSVTKSDYCTTVLIYIPQHPGISNEASHWLTDCDETGSQHIRY